MSSVLVISAQWTTNDILCWMRILSFHERQNHQKLKLISCICMRRQQDGGVGGKLNHYSSACCNSASNKYILEVRAPISSGTKWAATYLLLTAFCVGFMCLNPAAVVRLSPQERRTRPIGWKAAGRDRDHSKTTQQSSHRSKMWVVLHYRWRTCSWSPVKCGDSCR